MICRGPTIACLLAKFCFITSDHLVPGVALARESGACGFLPEWVELICRADRGDARGFFRVGG